MVCVLEYGEHIGTLQNIFHDMQQARVFARQLIDAAEEEYTCIAKNKWFCAQKKEYVEIKNL